MDWMNKPDDELTSYDITRMAAVGNPANVVGPPRAASVYHCAEHGATVTGMGIQGPVLCCGQPMRQVS